MSKRGKAQSKQRRGGRQVPLDPGLSQDEARELLKDTSSPIELFKALAALGLCVAYGSWDDPTIKLNPAWAGYRAEQAQ